MDINKIAHRGLSAWAPENTELAFRLARECDCFGIECDVWRTPDVTYVVSHNNSLKKMCGVKKLITESTYEDIRMLPVTGGNAVAESPTQQLCTLQRFLHVVSESDKVAFIELKQELGNRELQEILEIVKSYGMYERTFFISIMAKTVLRLRHDLCFPRERLQYIHGGRARDAYVPVNDALLDRLIAHGIGLDAKYSLLDERAVDRMHDEGLLVNAWTIDTEKEFRRAVNTLGVDMITMNDVRNTFGA